MKSRGVSLLSDTMFGMQPEKSVTLVLHFRDADLVLRKLLLKVFFNLDVDSQSKNIFLSVTGSCRL